MDFELDLRDSEVTAFLRALESHQLPFMTALALNRTANDFQAAERGHLGEIFTLRRRRFAERSIKIRRDERATPKKPEVTVRVESPGGRSDIFAKFETETEKLPIFGGSIAVPSDNVPRTAAGIIPKRWRPRELLKDATRPGKRRRGRTAALLIRKPGGGTIFERDGSDLNVLYQLVRRVPIEPELRFVATARTTVGEVWARNFTRAFDRAIGIGR